MWLQKYQNIVASKSSSLCVAISIASHLKIANVPFQRSERFHQWFPITQNSIVCVLNAVNPILLHILFDCFHLKMRKINLQFTEKSFNPNFRTSCPCKMPWPSTVIHILSHSTALATFVVISFCYNNTNKKNDKQMSAAETFEKKNCDIYR